MQTVPSPGLGVEPERRTPEADRNGYGTTSSARGDRRNPRQGFRRLMHKTQVFNSRPTVTTFAPALRTR
jgi:hypothetical protein